MTKKMKKRAVTIGYGALLFLIAVLVKELHLIKNYNVQLILFLAAYLVTGRDVIKKAVRNLRNGQVLDENFLMTIASLGAFLISEMSEAVGVMQKLLLLCCFIRSGNSSRTTRSTIPENPSRRLWISGRTPPT